MKRTQIGWVFIIICLSFSFFFAFQVSGTSLIVAEVIVAIILILFYKLTITVDDESIRFSMGIGIIHGRYQLKDLFSCKVVEYFSLGWGIRIKYGAILFNVSGNRAIELVLRNRTSKIWLGTDTPEELVQFIRLKVSQLPKNANG